MIKPILRYKKITPKSYKDELKSEDNKKQYPTIHLNLNHVPQANGAKVGSMFEVALKLKLEGINTTYGNEAKFQIHGVNIIKSPKEAE